MTEIKNIIFTKSAYNCIQNTVYFINHLLPLKFKYTNESFVAIEEGKIKGLITLDKDSKSNSRFKITKFILEDSDTSNANQLVNYVITRYRAMGASSFYIVIDEKDADLLNIFQNELNFRACGLEYLYKINSINSSTLSIKNYKQEFSREICNFYNENINSFNRVLFARQPYQFKNNCIKYMFLDDKDNKILGYFELATKNNTDYYINFAIDCAYNIYLIDAIKYIVMKIRQKSKNFNLYVKIKDYFMNSKELIKILDENNAEFVSKSRILAKDYYKEIKENNLFKNAKIIFNDPTTA